MELYSKSDVGLVRDSNQDFYYADFLDEDVVLAIVCDGMGGANAGNVASKIAVEEIRDSVLTSYRREMQEPEIENMLRGAVSCANELVYEVSQNQPELRGMGTTVVASVIIGDDLYTAHAGDSRVYTISENAAEQVTKDHSMVQEMVETGEITQEQAQSHPRKNIITRALGISKELEIDYDKRSLEDKNAVVLCTDGLTNYLNDAKIYQIYKETAINDLADVLVSQAKDLGGADNITVVIITR